MSAGRWSDLAPRIASAVVMLLVGSVAVWQGGLFFAEFAVLVSAVMMWELARMTRGPGFDASWLVAALSLVVLATIFWQRETWTLGLLVLPLLLGLATPRRDKAAFLPYALLILFTSISLIFLREIHGILVVFWLLAVVVISDVAGYFVGRVLGGPKFWPALSPKKTWSGTVAGWLGAFLIGGLFWALAGWSPLFLFVSPLVAFAGQLGDIAESAIKRRAGVKDASNLIPGHGGVMDRFDALAVAAVVTVALQLVLQFLPLEKG